MRRAPSERTVVLLVGAVQFVNVLDFMMVMPLGPDFAAALGIAPSRLGLVGGAYTLAAAAAGIAGASFLDRFDRRRALAAAMLGLVASTFAGGLAVDLWTMLAARVAAGVFGGPATSLSISIVADAVPEARRGRALGAVMSAFSIAAVLGVPAGLELARLGGWRAPFFSVAALGLVVAGAALALMPPMTDHLARARGEARLPRAPVLRTPLAIASLCASASAMLSAFAITPNVAAWLQLNLGFPRARLGLLYMAGGAVTFGTLRIAGWLVDRVGSARVATGATAGLLAVLWIGFAAPPPGLSATAIGVLFAGMMVSISSRNVALNALATRVPPPAERARFQSAQSAVQHLASALGAGASSRLLSYEDGRLVGMTGLALAAGAVAIAQPVLVAVVAAGLRRRREQPRPARTEAV